jgi:CheY-like chemotaxis protein
VPVVLVHSMEKNENKRVLVVEDSADGQMLLKTLLDAKGFSTECTSNGKEALSLLRSVKMSKGKLPRVILLDLNMPVMGGIDFRRIQQNDPFLKDIPVVIMSGESDMAKTRKQTNAEVLMKPLNILKLIEALERNSKLH